MYDTIVIGLGGMGSATACHLARRGQKVLGLEQHAIGHAMGSSHGQTRIIRKAYFEHPDYVPLLQTAYRHWNDLAAQTNEEIINLCGLVLAGRDDDMVVAGTRHAALIHGLPLEEVSTGDVAGRCPGLQLPKSMAVLHDPDGGYLRVEHCVRAHLAQARSAGAELRDGEQVHSWEARAGMVEVLTRKATYKARNLALCAGPWTGHLLQELALPLTTHRVVTAWFPSNNPAHHAGKGAPVFALQTPDGFFYGFPQLDQRGVKIAEHRPGTLLTHPGDIDRVVAKEDVRRIQNFAQGYLKNLRTDSWTGETCIYTMSPDGDFIVDRHPKHKNVFLAAGFSGHGFKFAPAIGSIMADFCEHGRTEHPVAFLGLSRFT